MIFRGAIIEESLRDNRFLNRLRVVGCHVTDSSRWHVFAVEIPRERISDMGAELRPGAWYMHFWHGSQVFVVFRDRVFEINYDLRETWKDAVEYGLSVGIPPEQLDFLIDPPKDGHIAEAQVFVTDLARAGSFYSGVLGFRLKSKGDSWLIYDAGLEFVVMAGATKSKNPNEYGACADTVICIEVNDIEKWYKRLLGESVRFVSEVQSLPQGRFAAFSDPDGNLFELIEPS